MRKIVVVLGIIFFLLLIMQFTAQKELASVVGLNDPCGKYGGVCINKQLPPPGYHFTKAFYCPFPSKCAIH